MKAVADSRQIIAAIVVEYWRLLQSFERIIDLVTPDAKARFIAQARYSAGRLEQLTQEAGLRIVVFDGVAFEPNLPAVAINADDFSSIEELIVERTIEPAVIYDTKVVLMGRVYLTKAGREAEEIPNVSRC